METCKLPGTSSVQPIYRWTRGNGRRGRCVICSLFTSAGPQAESYLCKMTADSSAGCLKILRIFLARISDSLKPSMGTLLVDDTHKKRQQNPEHCFCGILVQWCLNPDQSVRTSTRQQPLTTRAFTSRSFVWGAGLMHALIHVLLIVCFCGRKHRRKGTLRQLLSSPSGRRASRCSKMFVGRCV